MRRFKPIHAFLLIVLVSAGLQIKDGQDTYESQVRACERANEGLRQPLYDFFEGAIRVRLGEARTSSSPEERRSARQAAEAYMAGQQEQIDAAADVAPEEGSPLIDCEIAYPQPTIIP